MFTEFWKELFRALNSEIWFPNETSIITFSFDNQKKLENLRKKRDGSKRRDEHDGRETKEKVLE